MDNLSFVGDEYGRPVGSVPELSFEMVKAGGLHTCGVVRISDEADEVQCWGSTEYEQGHQPCSMAVKLSI